MGLGYELTSDYNERTRIMAFSQVSGQIAWMIVPWFWVLIADPDLFETQAEGVQTLALWVGGGCMVLGLIPGLFCKGIDSKNIDNLATISLKTMWENLVSVGKKHSTSFLQPIICKTMWCYFPGI